MPSSRNFRTACGQRATRLVALALAGAANSLWAQTSGPANDHFANATALSGYFGQIDGTLVGATRENGDPVLTGLPLSGSVWYRWVAPATGVVGFSVAYSGDEYIGAYAGATLENLTLLSNNAQSRGVTFNVSAGLSYTILVDHGRGTALPFSLQWSYNGPILYLNPVSVIVAAGQSATFRADALGYGTNYQWNFNGNPIPGATRPSYTIASVTPADVGNYSVTIADANGILTTAPATLSIPFTTIAYLSNLSVLARAGSAAETITLGLTVNGGVGDKTFLIRGIGPTLATFGVASPLPDPTLTISRDGLLVFANDDWINGDGYIAATRAVGAFPLPLQSKDALLLQGVDSGKSYIVELAGKDGAVGTALVELYDSAVAASIGATSPRLANLSARAVGGAGADTLTVGFIVGGTGTLHLLLRASGPALTKFGLVGTMADPKLELFNTASVKLAENDDWDSTTASAQTSVGAFSFPAHSKDSVIVTSLPAGSYTARVTAVGNAFGIALVELYELP